MGIFKSSYDNVLRLMPQNLTDDKSTLVQVMAWCRQAPSHYLSQCWPRSLRHLASLGPNELNLHFSTNYTSFNVCVKYFVWNLKGYLWNFTQNIKAIHWKIRFSYNVENSRALRFTSLFVFLKCPQGMGPETQANKSSYFVVVMEYCPIDLVHS